MEDIRLLGACGLYCGGCDCYRISLDEGKHLLRTEKFKSKDLETMTCNGCHSDKLTEWCSKCKIRLCAKEKAVLHCGLCKSYPCEVFEEFKAGGRKWPEAKHRNDISSNLEELTADGEEKWLQDKREYWKCGCGFSYSFYEEKCHMCGQKLDSYATTR